MHKFTSQNYEIDKLDIQIMHILMQNGNTPYTEVAKALVISAGTVHVRMKKLVELGIAKHTCLEINPQKLGYDVVAFLGIYLDKGSHYHEALNKIDKIPEIVELHYTTGTYAMFAKVVCRDTAHLRTVLNENIQVIDGIQRTETFISLEEPIKRQIKLM